jgi:dTDP-4-dehydrorhamnose reductase
MERRWLVTGAGGMAGRDLVEELEARGEETIALTKADLDITNPHEVKTIVRDTKPSVIVNCAAFTKVDAAEEQEGIANAINGSSVEFIARAANDVDALLVQLSTDFVFDGSKRAPYDINDECRPLSAYGRSKRLGELAATHADKHLIVRTSWLFGVNGPNFVEAIRNQIQKGTNPLRVVDDQRGRPTYTPHLAHAIIRLAQLDARGVAHYADDDECSWYDFACEIAEDSGVTVTPVSTDEFPRPALRPSYSVLSTERYERLTGVRPESWREGLRDYRSKLA